MIKHVTNTSIYLNLEIFLNIIWTKRSKSKGMKRKEKKLVKQHWYVSIIQTGNMAFRALVIFTCAIVPCMLSLPSSSRRLLSVEITWIWSCSRCSLKSTTANVHLGRDWVHSRHIIVIIARPKGINKKKDQRESKIRKWNITSLEITMTIYTWKHNYTADEDLNIKIFCN